MRHYDEGRYPDFAEFLNTAQQFIVCDLWTLYVSNPAWNDVEGLTNYSIPYRYTTWDKDVTLYDEAGNPIDTWVATGPLIERDRVRSVIGVEVDRLQMRVYANDTMLIRGRPFLQAAVRGDLDGCRVELERAFFDSSMQIKGVLKMFAGRLAPSKVSRSVAEFEIAADLELLNIQMPRNLYQAGCQNTLYDAGCKVSQVDVARDGTVGAGATTTTFSASMSPSAAAGTLDLGGVLFTSGALEGVVCTIKSWDGATVSLINPLPFAPAAGDTFKAWYGCNKTTDACTNKFNNVVNFRGFPFVPVPETMR